MSAIILAISGVFLLAEASCSAESQLATNEKRRCRAPRWRKATSIPEKKLRYEFDKLESIDHLYVESSAAAAMKAITKWIDTVEHVMNQG